jgi:hypothetical protein
VICLQNKRTPVKVNQEVRDSSNCSKTFPVVRRVIPLSPVVASRSIRNHKLLPIAVYLNQDRAQPNITPICVELQRQVHIGSPQDGSLIHTTLKRLKSLLTGLRPLPRHIVLQQTVQRGTQPVYGQNSRWVVGPFDRSISSRLSHRSNSDRPYLLICQFIAIETLHFQV